MRFPAKFVAMVLLLAFWAVPGVAVAQCLQPAAPAHMHCSHCAMKMAMDSQTRIAAPAQTAPCCRMLPSAPTPKPVSATQASERLVATASVVVAQVVAPAARRAEDPAAPERAPHRRTQSLLCTFLI